MKKALFIVALYLVPFLSLGAEVSNIFEDGTVITQPSELKTVFSFDVAVAIYTSTLGGDGSCDSNCRNEMSKNWATPLALQYFNENYTCTGGTSSDFSQEDYGSRGVKFTLRCIDGNGDIAISYIKSYSPSISNYEEVSALLCPPSGEQYSTYLYGIKGDGGETTDCADPEQINQVDSCDVTSGNEYLTIDVSAPSGCFPQADGSICKYNSVDVGGGNQYYAMDLEGDCYANPDDLPNLNGTPKDNPVGESCVDYGGGVLGCPENPENVCSDSGSGYAGGSIANCQTGCGMVNDQFLCIDEDTDGDGLPDYNDPDIDGDGIANDDDLDSDGDGQDDPINGGDGDGSGGSNINLKPVVDELKKLNKQFESQGDPDDIDKDDKLTKKNDDYKTKLEELRDKDAETMGYVDVLELDSSSSLVIASIPENSCRNFAFVLPTGSVSLDTCVVADKVRPILTWLFGILTAWHIFFLINKTLREGV